MSGLHFPGYVWRGRSYKTVLGLFRAVERAGWTGYGMNFDAGAMCLRPREGGETVRFARTFGEGGVSLVADDPSHE